MDGSCYSISMSGRVQAAGPVLQGTGPQLPVSRSKSQRSVSFMRQEPKRFLSPASGSISKAGCLPKTMCSKTFTHEKAEAKATGPASGVLGLNSYFPCGSVILAKALTQAFVQIQ